MSIITNEDQFSQFLVNAKIATYASGDDLLVVTPKLKNSHQLEYSEGNLLYRDIYYGGLYFIGMETVFQHKKPIWGMSYYGSMFPDSSSSQISGMPSVLKTALRKVPIEAPFRGPPFFQKDDYEYRNEFHGDIPTFHGIETIYFQEQAIYQLHYSGGVVK